MADTDLSRAVWRKSRRSGNGNNCVEVADLKVSIGVRDSKAPTAGHISLAPTAWVTFVANVRTGHFDLP